ncbi:MAG: hypothetical protein HY698_19855 [Deltaproteobacteria bacterium]|nr:hypothetical protein [Deltaproteobacteria bacterium]
MRLPSFDRIRDLRLLRCAVMLICASHWTLGCASSSLPAVHPVSAGAFASHQVRVQAVDLLPIDVEIAVHQDAEAQARMVADGFDRAATSAVATALGQRRYQVGAVISWDGQYLAEGGALVLAHAPQELEGTARALAEYGQAQARYPGELLAPSLPVRLGDKTGSSATLYVGGFAYKGPEKSGNSALKKVLIGAAIVGAVIVLVKVLKGDGGQIVSTAGRAAAGAGRAAARVTHATVRGVGRATGHLLHGIGHAMSPVHGDVYVNVNANVVGSGPPPQTTMATPPGASPAVAPPRPFPAEPAPPAERPRPRLDETHMLIEMTLVDNSSGQVLWHARQVFKADPSKPEHVSKVMKHMLASLPER